LRVIRRANMTEVKQPEAGFVETNETSLYYEMMGEGHPLVLIHGGYMDRRMWDDQAKAQLAHEQTEISTTIWKERNRKPGIDEAGILVRMRKRCRRIELA
jgi:hypothetical protein